MYEWLSEYYMRLMANFEIMQGYLVECFAVDRLRTFAVILFGIFVIKLAIHIVLYYWLKRKFSPYNRSEHPGIYRLLNEAAGELGLKRVPSIYAFGNFRPLLFTIGTFRPAIFLAPVLYENLSDVELKAALKHELVHIKRLDSVLKWMLEITLITIPVFIIQFFAVNFVYSTYLSNVAIATALVLIFLFRFVIWKPILFLRELSCDDLVVRFGTDPLDLASALIKVMRYSKRAPLFRWQYGLALTQRLLPSSLFFDYRTKRLLNYTPPRLKFLIVKGFKIATAVVIIGISTFLWEFHSRNGGFDVNLQEGPVHCPIQVVENLE